MLLSHLQIIVFEGTGYCNIIRIFFLHQHICQPRTGSPQVVARSEFWQRTSTLTRKKISWVRSSNQVTAPPRQLVQWMIQQREGNPNFFKQIFSEAPFHPNRFVQIMVEFGAQKNGTWSMRATVLYKFWWGVVTGSYFSRNEIGGAVTDCVFITGTW